jgi:phenylalanyl-tRNA synthetase beta chain
MRIFELGTIFPPGAARPYRGRYEVMPPTAKSVGLALVADEPGETLFRQAKGLLEMIQRYCFLPDLAVTGAASEEWADPSAQVAVRVNDTPVGALALLRPRVLRRAGIDGVQVAYAEFDLGLVTAQPSRDNQYAVLPELPESSFDLSVVLADAVTWGVLQDTVRKADPLIAALEHIGEYRQATLAPGHRSLTLRITLQPYDATLTKEEIGRVRDSVIALLEREFGATLR